jgi:hypothetical protein
MLREIIGLRGALLALPLLLGGCAHEAEDEAIQLGRQEQAVSLATCDTSPSNGCCSVSELTPRLVGGRLKVDGDLTLCGGEPFPFGISIVDASGTESDPLLLDCGGTTIWGGDDPDRFNPDRPGARGEKDTGIFIHGRSGSADHIEVKNCQVAGWYTGIKVTTNSAPFDPDALSPRVWPKKSVLADDDAYVPPEDHDPDSDPETRWAFDHRDLPLPVTNVGVNLTNVTLHRNAHGLDYSGRSGTFRGLRVYRNRGPGIHIAPHARDLLFENNGTFTFNVYENGLPGVPNCVTGMFTEPFCRLRGVFANSMSGIQIDSAHDITLRNGTVNNNGRHGIAIYKNCGEHLGKPRAFHRRSLLNRNILIQDMTITNHMRGWQNGGYKISTEMLQSAGVMIGARQGLRNLDQNGCHDLAGYVYTDDADHDSWFDLTWTNRKDWQHWDFAQGVTVKGGTIAHNYYGAHIADSNASIVASSSPVLFSDNFVDVVVGNYVRDQAQSRILADDDTIIGVPPVKNVNLSGAPSASLACTQGTASLSGGVLHRSCTRPIECVEDLDGKGHGFACGER